MSVLRKAYVVVSNLRVQGPSVTTLVSVCGHFCGERGGGKGGGGEGWISVLDLIVKRFQWTVVRV